MILKNTLMANKKKTEKQEINEVPIEVVLGYILKSINEQYKVIEEIHDEICNKPKLMEK